MPDQAVQAAAAGPESEVRAALATHESTASLSTARLTVQLGGLSNHAWIAHDAGVRYFVRLSPPGAGRLGVDRDAECSLLAVVAAAGLAPEVIRCDPARRLLVTRGLEGRPWQREEAIAPRNIALLAQALRRLHARPVPSGTHNVDFAVQARHLAAHCTEASPANDAMRESAGQALAVLNSHSRAATLCHNDLHYLNLIEEGGRLWLVDWEYGGAGDPLFDLASFLCQHDCGDLERALLLEAYGEHPWLHADSLAAACRLFDYVQWLWYRAWPGAAAGTDDSAVYRQRATVLARRLASGRT